MQITLANEKETQELARDLACIIKPGNLITLSGELGAGKTAFARAFIRHYLHIHDLEVTSPTYLLAHEYENASGTSLLHVDLYRLSDPREVDELNLQEALQNGVVIVEWPQMGKGYLPPITVQLSFEITGEQGRVVSISGNDNLISACQRTLKIGKFLRKNWGENILRHPFAADASARNYELVRRDDKQRLLMDAPKAADGPIIASGRTYSQIAHLAEEVIAFVTVAKMLRDQGFRAPKIYASDLGSGLVLLEHLGDGKIVDDENRPIANCYCACGELLAEMHQTTWPQFQSIDTQSTHRLPLFDQQAITVEVQLLTQWYLLEVSETPAHENDIHEFNDIWSEYCGWINDFESSIMLRDFHSPNIIWPKGKLHTPKQDIGIVDFQDAVKGPSVYDLVSLTQDARVVVSHDLEQQIIDQYVAKRLAHDAGFDIEKFKFEYAVMGAQRASKILGIFVRLDKRDNKPIYKKLLPQVRQYLQRNLQHPKLTRYRQWCEKVIQL